MVGTVIKGVPRSVEIDGVACFVSVFVVDDGSRDATSQAAQEAGAHVIRHMINTGAGGATRTGIAAALAHGADVIATMDADGQHAIEDVVAGIKLLVTGQKQMLIGTRLAETTGMPRYKVIGNKGISFITNLLYGVNVTDSQSGLRIFSRDAAERIQWKTDTYSFCSEMIWRARQKGIAIEEYAIQTIYSDYSMTKGGQSGWNGINILRDIVRHRMEEFLQ